MRLCRQQYKGRDGKTRESAKWYVEVKDHEGRRRRIPGFTDKGPTAEIGRQVERLISLRAVKQPPTPELSAWLEGMPAAFTRQLAKWGILDARHVGHSKPLAEHVSDFERSLEAKANTARYVAETGMRVRAVLDGCGFKFSSELSAARVASWLADQRAKAMGTATSNHYLTAVKGFCAWLVRERRITANPLGHLSRLNGQADIRRERRALAADIFARLVDAAENGPTHNGLTGRERAMLYRTAAYTGLRASELASLTCQSFDLEGEPATVTVEAAYSKRRRTDVLPLHPDLAERLGRWFQERSTATERESVVLAFKNAAEVNVARLWPGAWAEKRHAAAMLREDLKAAGIEYDDGGRVFDFHALRHQFITSLAQAGVHPKTAQELARHSTITLTLDRYSHVGLYDQNAAIASLPAMPSAQAATAQSTGTDDAHATVQNVLPKCLPKRTAERRVCVHRDALTDDAGDIDAGATETPANQGESHDSKGIQCGEIGIRTRDAGFPTYRISNPALSATQPSLRRAGPHADRAVAHRHQSLR
jgi:integrase